MDVSDDADDGDGKYGPTSKPKSRSVFQSILVTPIWFPSLNLVPLNTPTESKKVQTISSGYLLASAASAALGGIPLSASFVSLLVFTETIEAPPFFAAVGAGLFTIFAQMLSINVLLLTDPASTNHSMDYLRSLLLFSVVIGLTEAAKSTERWEADWEGESDELQETMGLGAKPVPKAFEQPTDPVHDDLRKWDEKLFNRQKDKQQGNNDKQEF